MGDHAARPSVPRTSTNLIEDAGVNNADNWTLLRGASFDKTTSRTVDNSGSIKLVKPPPKHHLAMSDFIPVRPNQRYTYGFHFKGTDGPTAVGGQIALFDAKRRYLRNLIAAWGGSSGDGVWEEFTLPFVAPADAAFVRAQVYKGPNTSPGGMVWADDFYIGEGLSLLDAPSPKRAFEGGQVRVDALGNFEIRRGEQWQPFFPLSIYSDNYRDWSVYSQQGWNTVIWAGSADQVQQAKAAVSDFNPDGMLAGFQISQYTFPGRLYNNVNHLQQQLSEIDERALNENLLLYYWDNENNHDQWSVPTKIINTVKSHEIKTHGTRQRPVYALQGTYNMARVHAARDLVDVSGTYFGGAANEPQRFGTKGHEALLILDRQHGQSTPAAFAQFNRVEGAGDMRLRLYNAIILGARAMGYWRDCYRGCNDKQMANVGPVDSKPWWPDFPNLRREIDALLPIIRQPHWTDWSVASNLTDRVRIGKRELNDHAYLIVVNQTTQNQQLELVLDALPYEPEAAINALTDEVIATVRNGTFNVKIPGIGSASGTLVLQLE